MDAAQLPGVGMVTVTGSIGVARARQVASKVVDPEIPVLTVRDLGILRDVQEADGRVMVTITPTYSGCPAMRQIEDDLVAALQDDGFDQIEVRVVHNPPWASDWITAEGRRKLADFGIAPPSATDQVLCPRCTSSSPRMIARFGSTACKALMLCSSCGEPFDHFKEF